jgi:hypothetical protein
MKYTISYATRFGGQYYLGDVASSGVNSLDRAALFSTVSGAIAHYAERAKSLIDGDRDVKVVSVRETPASNERVVLDETQKHDGTVRYAAVFNSGFFGAVRWGVDLEDARLFNTQGEAIAAIVNDNQRSWGDSYPPHVNVVRVAITPSTPKLVVVASIG